MIDLVVFLITIIADMKVNQILSYFIYVLTGKVCVSKKNIIFLQLSFVVDNVRVVGEEA